MKRRYNRRVMELEMAVAIMDLVPRSRTWRHGNFESTSELYGRVGVIAKAVVQTEIKAGNDELLYELSEAIATAFRRDPNLLAPEAKALAAALIAKYETLIRETPVGKVFTI